MVLLDGELPTLQEQAEVEVTPASLERLVPVVGRAVVLDSLFTQPELRRPDSYFNEPLFND